MRDIANFVFAIGASIYFGGYIWSGVMAYRLKQYLWLFGLLLGPLFFPFFALTHIKSSRSTFWMLCVGFGLALIGGIGLVLTRPNSISS